MRQPNRLLMPPDVFSACSTRTTTKWKAWAAGLVRRTECADVTIIPVEHDHDAAFGIRDVSGTIFIDRDVDWLGQTATPGARSRARGRAELAAGPRGGQPCAVIGTRARRRTGAESNAESGACAGASPRPRVRSGCEIQAGVHRAAHHLGRPVENALSRGAVARPMCS